MVAAENAQPASSSPAPATALAPSTSHHRPQPLAMTVRRTECGSDLLPSRHRGTSFIEMSTSTAASSISSPGASTRMRSSCLPPGPRGSRIRMPLTPPWSACSPTPRRPGPTSRRSTSSPSSVPPSPTSTSPMAPGTAPARELQSRFWPSAIAERMTRARCTP